MGIEPTLAAWEAAVLPLNYTRIVAKILGCHCRVGKYISLHFLQLCLCRRPLLIALYCEKGREMISPLASRSDFPVFNELTYLNTASMGLMPLSVHHAARRVEEEIALRGTTWFDEVQEIGILERARKAASRLLHAPVDSIAVCTSFTEALCQIAWALAPSRGSNIVSVDLEFPSVPYPWMRVCAATGAEMRLVETANRPERLSFDALARVVDSKTAVICVSHAQYSTGFRFDLKALAELAHAHSA